MTLPLSLADIVLPRPQVQIPLLEAVVTGKMEFPSAYKNTLLLHGTFGSGKTSLARLLPILIEYSRADNATRVSYNWVYKTSRETVSITPGQADKPSIEADVDFIACLGQRSDARQKAIQSIQTQMLLAGGFASTYLQYFIFDEVDEWAQSQSDLKALITNAGARSVFLLTTNYVNRIDPGLRSRSIEIDMNQPEAEDVLARVRALTPQLKRASDDALLHVIRSAKGDWRTLNTQTALILMSLATT
jgi:replication-associated recombination protein RarA